MTPGQKLLILRERKGYTQSELTEELNKRFTFHKAVTREMYANWETDRNEFPWEYAKAFVKYFGITLDQLILETEKLPTVTVPKKTKKAVAH